MITNHELTWNTYKYIDNNYFSFRYYCQIVLKKTRIFNDCLKRRKIQILLAPFLSMHACAGRPHSEVSYDIVWLRVSRTVFVGFSFAGDERTPTTTDNHRLRTDF